MLLPLPLPISLSSIIPILTNQVLRPIIKSPREIRVENILRTLGISLLRIERCSRHVRHSGVPTALGILCVSEGMVLWGWLGEPYVSAVATQVAGFHCCGDVFFYDDGASGGVYEPGSWGWISGLCKKGGVEGMNLVSFWKSNPY